MKKKAYNQERWNLKGLLKTHKGSEFEKILKSIDEEVKIFEGYRKELCSDISAERVVEITKHMEKISVEISKISSYSYMLFSTNTKSQDAITFKDKIIQHLTELGNKTIFFSLWFKSLDENDSKRIINSSGEYKYFFEKLRLRKDHTLTEPEEKIINIKDITGSEKLIQLYDTITNNFLYEIKIKGKKLKLNQSQLSKYLRSSDPKLRELTYKTILLRYNQNKDVLGEIYKGIVTDWKNECINLRNYKMYISPRNLSNNISDKAIETMLEVCKKNSKVFQEYFNIKAKLMKTKKLLRYHIYAPIHGKEKKYKFNDALNLVFGCYNSFSPEMEKLARKIVDEKHLDSLINDSKMGGAYCMDIAPGVTPYVLVNYTGTERDVSTLAHELGHGIHDLLSSKQVPLLSHAPLILAETASVFGEMIVTEKLLKDEKNKKIKQILISSKLDDIYATVIRQSYFVMFEIEAHKAIEKGATIDEISDLWLKTLKDQFGSSVKVTDDFKNEFMYIPHIYHTPFYCYAYSFGNLLVLALYQMYKTKGESFVPKYIKFLSYGGSKKPSEIGAELGIDFESEKFWQQGFDMIKEMVKELKQSM